MKFGKKSMGAVAAGLSLAMALTGFAPAVALAEQPETPTVEKIVQLNNGSTVDATFTFKAEPTVLFKETDNETETHTVTATIGSKNTIEVKADGSKAENKGEATINFGNFDHAGVYAWTVTEVSSSAADSKGTFQNNTENKTYTLVAVVSNPSTEGGAYTVSSYQVWDGVPTATEVEGKVQYSGSNTAKKSDKATFTNKYTENTDENNSDKNPSNLTITKTVTGAQGDKSKDFTFTVTFTIPKGTILPKDKTAADVLNEIKATATDGATIKTQGQAVDGATTRTFTFTAKDAKSVTFTNILVGTTYKVEEAEANKGGYKTTWAAVSNGTSETKQDGILVGEKTNTGTMTNAKEDTVVTGLIVNNAPFIVMIGVAAAGVAAYGTAKRKLEK